MSNDLFNEIMNYPSKFITKKIKKTMRYENTNSP